MVGKILLEGNNNGNDSLHLYCIKTEQNALSLCFLSFLFVYMFTKIYSIQNFFLICFNYVLKRMLDSKYVPSFIKKKCAKLALKLVVKLIPTMFSKLTYLAVNSKSSNVSIISNRVFGYKVADHISDTKKVAIHVELQDKSIVSMTGCSKGNCVLGLRGESCGPFETIYCETCGTNICSLKVPYMTEQFHKKYMGLKD